MARTSEARSRIRLGVCTTAIAVSLCTPAYAQEAAEAPQTSSTISEEAAAETTDSEDQGIIVVGQRRALQRAEDRKRNADTIVDGIDATDIGAFPDKSVAEALQRIPGVTVIRSNPTDAMHYPADPSAIIIRGLLQTRSEFNGRDSFSATSGQGLSWADISPEILAAADVYKNQTAEMIEGGIAGTVNLRTRLPFDQKGQLISANFQVNYGDLSKEPTFDISGVYSNRWNTGIGEIGLLANVAYSHVLTRSQGASLPRMMPFVPGAYGPDEVFIPSGVYFNETDYDRKRQGISLAGQWKSTDGKLRATVQFNRSKYDNTWTEHALESYWAYVDPSITNHLTVFTDPSLIAPPDAPGLGFNQAGGGTPFTFREDGLFQTGVITASRGGWGFGSIDWSGSPPNRYVPGSTDQFGVLPDGRPLYVPCLNSNVSHANQPCRAGSPLDTATRFSKEKRVIQDLGVNFAWDATERLTLTLDAQRLTASGDHDDVTNKFRTHADIDLDLTGDFPKVNYLQPSGYNVVGGGNFLQDAWNYSPNSLMDHISRSEGKLTAVRLDAAYDLDSTWLDELRVGGRFAERKQDHRWSAYNWQAISSDWQANPADAAFLQSGPTYNADGTIRFQGYEPGYWETRSFGENILGGGLINPNQFVFMTEDIIRDRAELARRFSVAGQTDQGGVATTFWNPVCDRPEELPDSCFTQGELIDVSETTKSGYVMLKFGGSEARPFGMDVRGNIGVRYVESEVESGGALNYALPFNSAELTCVPLTPEQIANLGPNQYAISASCLAAASQEDRAFASGGSTGSTVRTTHRNWLPSFNIRFGLGENTFLRFAASRALSKPDIGLLKNYVAINRRTLQQTDVRIGNPNIVLDASGNPVSYRYSYTAGSSNPRLKPIRADQVDLSIEHYFSGFGSLTGVVFYKKFKDYIQNGTFLLPVTNAGVTRDVLVTAPVNGSGASIQGFEIAFQRFFDFLPAPFDGFGVQTNYTRIKNSGVKNANLTVDTTGGDAVARSAQPGMINPGRLENLSDHAVNAILMYEKTRFGARLAYNWRSKYLNSVNDCCLGFPVWNKAEGFLDASLRYAVTPNIEISVQGSNLLKTRAEIIAQVKGPSDLNPDEKTMFLPAAWFEHDRRFQLGVRAKF